MSAKSKLALIFTVTVLGCGTWLLAQRSQDSPPKSGGEPTVYSICNPSNDVLMLDALRGKTWILRRRENGKPTWLPVPRIDSEKEATQSWQKGSNYVSKDKINGKALPVETLLKERGYVAVPLKLLNTGHLCLNVQIEGRKVFVAVDTGAPFTHLDSERVKHLQLKWQPYVKEGDGKAPKTQANSWCEVRHFEIGGFDLGPIILWGNDLSDINSGIILYRVPQIDGLLGADVLSDLKAIIDYSTRNLYIRVNDSQK